MSKILGIDLGTTFSAVAVVEGGEPKVLENAEGDRTTPSVVAISKSGERLVGKLARRQQITNPHDTIFAIKRLMGRKFDDPVVQKNTKHLSYKIRKADNGAVQVKMGDEWYKPAEISAMILQKIKKDAEQKLGEEIEEAVITCPAYFNNSQRKATKVAGEVAGFKVRRVFNEPTAAALAYGLNKKDGERVVVYDLGGGTFDISVLEVGDDTVEVVATGGDTWLGGEDFDREIVNWVLDRFGREEGVDLSEDSLAKQRIKEAAEKAKIELSTAMETEINIPFITSDDDGPKNLSYKLTRAKLEELTEKYVQKSIKLVNGTLKEAKVKSSEIDDVILVGGQTRMPKIQEEVEKLFSKKSNSSINPDEVVAIGAAVQAGIFQGDVKDVLLLDVTPLTLGIETMGGVSTPLIEKNTTVPTTKNKTFSTAANNQTSVEIHAVQGERSMAKDNKSLGRFVLDGIPPAPRGVPKIDVSFDINANGILEVSAEDQASGKSQSIRIEGTSGLSEDEVEKMRAEAEKHAEEDEKKKELIDARNAAESLVYTAKKTIEDAEIEDKSSIEEKIKALDEIREGQDTEEIKKKTEDLSSALQEVGAKMYEQASSQTVDSEEAEEADLDE